MTETGREVIIDLAFLLIQKRLPMKPIFVAALAEAFAAEIADAHPSDGELGVRAEEVDEAHVSPPSRTPATAGR